MSHENTVVFLPQSHFRQSPEHNLTLVDFKNVLISDGFFHISFSHLWSGQLILR